MALATLFTQSVAELALASVIFLVLYFFTRAVYNLYFHPLAKYPGPLLWRASRLPFVRSVWSGWVHHDVQRIHRRYGDIVRIAPNELSFAKAEAWEDIYTSRGDNLALPKTPVWHKSVPGKAPNLVNLVDLKDHARVRRALDPGFTTSAVLKQEPMVQKYTEALIDKLRKRCGEDVNQTTVIDVVEWINYVTFDVIGDLGFGEAFDCLENNEYHPWMKIIFDYFIGATLVCTLRFFPLLFEISQLAVPRDLKKRVDYHWRMTLDKVDRRLALAEERPDFFGMLGPDIVHLIGPKDDEQSEGAKRKIVLPRGELYANANLFIVAGSETIVTVITGAFNHLVKNPSKLRALTKEVRKEFVSETSITFATLKDLPYLNAVLQEALRMCNPVPMGLPRITPPQGAIVAGHVLPGNTFVSTHAQTLSFSPQYWHEPDKFHPERWLPEAWDPLSKFAADNTKSIRPFGIGPQSCIGQPLAWAEMRLIMARIVWAFDVEEVDSVAGKLRWEEQRAFAVVEKRPFEVRLRARGS